MASELLSRWIYTQKGARSSKDASSPSVVSLNASECLKPLCSTCCPCLQARLSDTNLLYELDRATQEIVSALVEAQANGPPRLVEVGDGVPPIRIERMLGLPELRRYKRTFLKLASQNQGSPPPDSLTVKKMFVDYINREMASDQN